MGTIEQLTAIAPGKLILSGEHAVVYGQPAIAIAVAKYTTATTTWRVPVKHGSMISFKLLDLKYAKEHTLHTLDKFKQQLQANYLAFLQGKLNLGDVLKRPFELLQYTVSTVLDKLNIQLPRGVEIKMNSDIPIGCGMGSSAAAIMSALYALVNLFKLEIEPSKFLKLGLEVENMQHGRSSGLDLHLATFGGGMRYQAGKSFPRQIPQIPLYMVNTGTPESSTGECVQYVKPIINKPRLLADFAAVTEDVDLAWQRDSIADFKAAIIKNNELLIKIGVVPDKVASFIRAVEVQGGAAKICGAGSVRGDKAGIVMLTGDIAKHKLAAVANEYGYALESVNVDRQGARLVVPETC